MVPLALIAAIIALTVAAAFWAVTEANDAVRQGVRAQSLGQDGCGAARAVLSDSLDVQCSATGGELGRNPAIRIVVEVPLPSAAEDYVPALRIEREAELP